MPRPPRTVSLTIVAVLVVGCGGSNKSASEESRAPAPAPTSPAPAVAAVEPDAAAEAPDEESPADVDSRDVAFVSVGAHYRSGGRDVYEELHDDDDDRGLIACFDAAFPHDKRFDEVYYFRIFVPNPAHDGQPRFGGGGSGGGMSYHEPDTYPELEECMRKVIVEYRAPPDVGQVAIRIHVHTHASHGVMGP
jgi:hypothetical protein